MPVGARELNGVSLVTWRLSVSERRTDRDETKSIKLHELPTSVERPYMTFTLQPRYVRSARTAMRSYPTNTH